MFILEVVANLVYVISVVLAARNSVHTWWTGIIGCILFAVLFFKFNLYADVTLMGFYILTSIYGWAYWNAKKAPNPIRRTDTRQFSLFVMSAVVAAIVYGRILYSTTDAYAPYIDSMILSFSVLAQLLLMKRRLETWVCWLIVDTIAVPLYASRGLYLTSFVYVIFWFNAWYGLYSWFKYYRSETNTEDETWKQNATTEG